MKARPSAGIVETVPSDRSLLVYYDPARIRGSALAPLLYERTEHLPKGREVARRHFDLPVCFQGDDALDLAALVDMKNMGFEELIPLHTATDYRVHMIGFASGFAYLGGLPKALHTSRLSVPRQEVVAGAVGIGGAQAAIASLSGTRDGSISDAHRFECMIRNAPTPPCFAPEIRSVSSKSAVSRWRLSNAARQRLTNDIQMKPDFMVKSLDETIPCPDFN
ncbi:MAG: hypothetical protein CMH13_16020 [Martelella sp.]|uniref:carboxyltransferase domain-containing protein n=1 Tax=unclassified Martelella TaxID=2629616 RepID=UPI000C466199|nr:carboxyltransferase domain-containing protein [Martelella sp.]MAU22014.1 hypothetical protein [Martelella sp.]